MLLEKKEFSFTTQGYNEAVEFLKRINRFSIFHRNLPIDDVISEANHIKQSQQILTEGN